MARLVVGNGWTCACDREKCSTECEYYLDFMSVKTNGDKIRAMTDEELAAWLEDRCSLPNNGLWLDWLKQEAD